ncbi:MAG TPA: endo alpha-1,4 polygalactosaminidase, partial [Terriglobales bacterium]
KWIFRLLLFVMLAILCGSLLGCNMADVGTQAVTPGGNPGGGSGGNDGGGGGTPGGHGLWSPALVTSWQWQLSSLPSANNLLNVQMYDVDGFGASSSLVSVMHNAGMHAVCYISAGTWEDWRSDADSFPSSVLGSGNGWPGEKWLDIRQIDALSPIMTARFQMCKDKGFDAVEPDNIDGYTNNTGFPLSYADQIAYNKWIATTVHSLGMSVALKNDLEQVADLLPHFDFAINEQCFQFNECDALTSFIAANKAVFEVEYNTDTSQFCPEANAMNFNALKKEEDLTATRVACR